VAEETLHGERVRLLCVNLRYGNCYRRLNTGVMIRF
jgi:hypothetical protein